MKISFVIPAHNEEGAIGDCVSSIFEEINKNAGVDAEVIVVDNASSDKTGEVARLHGAKVVNESHKGIVWARAAGLREAQGEIIANIDADNRMIGGWLRKVLDAFEKNPQMVCFSGPLAYRDISPWALVVTESFYGLGMLIVRLAHLFGARGAIVQGGNFVFRKEAMLRAGGYDTTVEFYGEDTAVAMKLAPLGDVVFSSSIPISSSGRRMVAEGVFATGFKYAINFVWVTIFKRPFHKHSTDIRPERLK